MCASIQFLGAADLLTYLSWFKSKRNIQNTNQQTHKHRYKLTAENKQTKKNMKIKTEERVKMTNNKN